MKRRQSSFDLVDGSVPAEAATANLLTKVNSSEVPLISEIDPDNFKPVFDEAVPLRGSQVLLAYNSQVVPPTPQDAERSNSVDQGETRASSPTATPVTEVPGRASFRKS